MVPKSSDSRYSLFDIAGPVMVGPSSSHTAGACKIGQYARALFNKTPEKVTFYLHGSFGQVYKGHATDRALLAGIMRFKTSDPNLKDAFSIAKDKGIDYEFVVKDLGAHYHANTVEIVLEAKGKKPMSVLGSSIGGGKMMIVKIDKFDVEIHGIAGKYKTLVSSHDLKPQTLSNLLNRIARNGVQTASFESTTYAGHGLSVINYFGRRLLVDEILELEKIEGVEFVRCLTKVPN
jgi:L-serine dehydratase